MEYISINDEEVETVEQEPELDTNPNENEHEVDSNKNTEEASNVDEIDVGRKIIKLDLYLI